MAANPLINDTPPARGVVAITPSDTVNFTAPIRSIYVGVTGNISFVGLDGVAADLPNVAAGAIYQVAMLRVNATGTTATSLRGLL